MSDGSIKRRRLVLSCFECKRRKLKCDRQLPICSRCIDVGRPEACKYDPRYLTGIDLDTMDLEYTVQDSWSNGTRFPDQPQVMEDPDPMLFMRDNSHLAFPQQPQLRQAPTSSNGTNSQLPLHLTDDPTSLPGNSVAHLPPNQTHKEQRKRPSGQFKGPSYCMSIFASFPGIREFLKDIIQGHQVLGAAKWDTLVPTGDPSLPVFSEDNIEQPMNDLLPTEQQCRRFTESYFEHFGGVYDVLHPQSFWQEYKNYWESTHHKPGWFCAVLLALMSCSRCLFVEEPPSFDGVSSIARSQAVQWIRAIEAWQKHRMTDDNTIEAFQIRCLVLISKTVNDIESKTHYTASQTLLADAISIGLHRDWTPYSVAETALEQNIRRKVWLTIADLEIARCIERGVPSMASNLFTDIVKSDAYDSDNQQTQSQLRLSVTDRASSPFACTVRGLRYSISSLVNNTSKHKSLSQSRLSSLRQQICDSLAALSAWPGPPSSAPSHKQGMSYRIVLCLYLHELLLLLHQPFVLAQRRDFSVDQEYFRFICIRSSNAIIETYEILAQGGSGQMILPTSRLLRAGLCLSLIEISTMNYGLHSLPGKTPLESKAIASALDMIERRTLALGTGLQDLWLLSMASCYGECSKEPRSPDKARKHADRVIALVSKMCLMQEHSGQEYGSTDTHLARYIAQIRRASDDLPLVGSEGLEPSAISIVDSMESPGLDMIEYPSSADSLFNDIGV